MAGGNKYRDYISKGDSSSTDVVMEYVLLSFIIDSKEERDITLIYIPNYIIQKQIEQEKFMAITKIRGILVDMLLYIFPDFYGPYVNMDRKVIKQLNTQYISAIYGTMIASLLYYFKFCKTLKLNRFKINSYDPCVANILVNVLQQSIIFHVNDCKLIHKDPKVNCSFIVVICEEYQIFFKMYLVQFKWNTEIYKNN